MISSKKITLISVILVSVCLIVVILFMIFPVDNLTDKQTGNVKYSDTHTVSYAEDDYYTDYSKGKIAKITLLKSFAESNSKNVSINNDTVTIKAGGTYVVSGILTNGCIIVDSEDESHVRLVLDNADITSSQGAAIYVKQAKKTIISLAQNTKNRIANTEKYIDEKLNMETGAVLCSEDDLTINGNGTLEITANFKDGIKADDTLKVTQGNITIKAKDEGINVNDYIATGKANIKIISGGDGIKCENEASNLGFIAAEETTFNIESAGDAIYSSSAIYLTDANANIKSGGGSETVTLNDTEKFGVKDNAYNDKSSTTSGKALKAVQNIVIKNGNMVLDSSDDAIHSDKDLDFDNCVLNIKSGDDAIHADKNITLNHKKINITKCLEGIEGGFIFVKGGETSIIAYDDGINALGENTNDFARPHMIGMRNKPISQKDIFLTIDGGSIYIECGGDGLDSNGAAVVNGGNILVYGPENSGNSSIDFQSGFVINGGTLVAAGSRGMAELPHNSSTQHSLSFYLNTVYDINSSLSLKDESGTEIIKANPKGSFDWVCISSDKIKTGGLYTLIINGKEEGNLDVNEIVTSNLKIERGGF